MPATTCRGKKQLEWRFQLRQQPALACCLSLRWRMGQWHVVLQFDDVSWALSTFHVPHPLHHPYPQVDDHQPATEAVAEHLHHSFTTLLIFSSHRPQKAELFNRLAGGWVFLLVLDNPGSPGQRAVKWLLLCCIDLRIQWPNVQWKPSYVYTKRYCANNDEMICPYGHFRPFQWWGNKWYAAYDLVLMFSSNHGYLAVASLFRYWRCRF